MSSALLSLAIEKLAKQFEMLPWEYTMDQGEIVRLWPGKQEEDIMVAVLKEYEFHEQLHRQDYYFFNYAYRHDYMTISDRQENVITVREGECYVGQPFSGYGIRQSGTDPAVVIGVLIRKDLFYRDFLPVVAADPAIFRFFIDPQRDAYSSDFLHFSFPPDSQVRSLLEMMVLEYADPQQETQALLRALTGALLLHIARRYRVISPVKTDESLSDQMIGFMREHMDSVSLALLGKQFSYHPTYVSNLLKKETGQTFSQILLQLRMERAVMLLKGTSLSVEEIAAMLGYSNVSNFYKAFREHYGVSPRDYGKIPHCSFASGNHN